MGATISLLKISVVFPFYTNSDNDHLINMPDVDMVRKLVLITVKLEPKIQIDIGKKEYYNMKFTRIMCTSQKNINYNNHLLFQIINSI